MNGPRDDGLCPGQPRASVPTSPFWRGQPQKMGVGAEFGGWQASNRVSLYRPPLSGMDGPRDDGLCPGQPRASVPTSPFWRGQPQNLGVGAESGGWRASNRVSQYQPPLSGTQGPRDDGFPPGQPRASVPTSPFWDPRPTRRRLGPFIPPNAALFTLPVGRSRRNRGGSVDHNAASGPVGVLDWLESGPRRSFATIRERVSRHFGHCARRVRTGLVDLCLLSTNPERGGRSSGRRRPSAGRGVDESTLNGPSRPGRSRRSPGRRRTGCRRTAPHASTPTASRRRARAAVPVRGRRGRTWR